MDPEKLSMEKQNNNYEKNGSIGSNPMITQGKIIMENSGRFQELWKKRLKSHPANLEPLRGNADYGKNGDGYYPSKLDFFFPIILSVTICTHAQSRTALYFVRFKLMAGV